MKVTKREYTEEGTWKNWQWRSIDDEFMNGAFFVESGVSLPVSTKDNLKSKPGSMASLLSRYSGTLPCRVGQPC